MEWRFPTGCSRKNCRGFVSTDWVGELCSARSGLGVRVKFGLGFPRDQEGKLHLDWSLFHTLGGRVVFCL